VGPSTYYPRVEERIVAEVKSYIIAQGKALKVRAKEELTDVNGIKRKTGEEWLIREPGAYLP
jgi:major vault protein